MIRSLAAKLTLAFLLIGLTGAILVAVIIQTQTKAAFNNFINNQQQSSLVSNLESYYQTNGSWSGVATAVGHTQPGEPMVTTSGHGDRPGGNPFTLVGLDHVVIYSDQPNEIGQTISSSDLNHAIVLQSNNRDIGWLVAGPADRSFNPNTPESNFLRNVNNATLVSAGVAILLALVLGGLLAFTMTRSLRELTLATGDIARGRFGKRVKVRSKDEIGELAESFNQMSNDLEVATNARRQMTADIAHDLRSPLSVITGYAEALSDAKLQGTPEIYNILLQETKHLDRLVDDLRLLSLADTGELPLNLQPTRPKALLERVIARHSVTSNQHQVLLRMEADDDLPIINIDVERISQVLDNLILNAFRYTPAGGCVELIAELDKDMILLRVKDNGSGIAPDDLPHVFDRFYRGDKSRTHNGESGLGLAIAKSIVEAHGGKISVISKSGQGTEFIISLRIFFQP